MTGFGRGVVSRDEQRATVELRSVNHRYLDIKLRGSISPSLEDQVAAKLRAALDRGAVTVAIHAASRPGADGFHIDEAAARQRHAALIQLASALGLPGPDLALVLAQPGVVVPDDDDNRAETLVPLVLDAVDVAIGELQQARSEEGAALAHELMLRIDELSRCRDAIAALAGGLAHTLQRKLLERIAALAGDIPADPGRLAQEAALLADRADISEELVRLESHLALARAAIAGSGSNGRRLDFLGQEVGREFNTIGAKSQHREISAAVIEAKTALEKFREQVQNVE